MIVRPIAFGSAEYEAAKALRRQFLREPLGRTLTRDDVAGEESQHHVGLFDDAGELVGALIGKPDDEDPRAIRLRQVVVHEARRGAGLGRRLLTEAEEHLRGLGFDRFLLYARPEACPFYERCGYATTGVERTLIGLRHREMRKGCSGHA